MASAQQNVEKGLEVCRQSCKRWIPRFGFIVLSFWFMMFFNMQSFGDGINFCFDASKEGYRLDTKVIKKVRASCGEECIFQCKFQDKSCRSANFWKNQTCEGQENCELLKTVDSEEPAKKLKRDENFDHYKLLQCERKLEDSFSSNGFATLKGLCEHGKAAFGIESGKIQDSQLKASSIFASGYTPEYGRLNGAHSWSAASYDVDANPWIQVDFTREGVVTAIATQGNGANYVAWVKTFSVSYGSSENSYEPYTINDVVQVFSGNSDQHSIVTNSFSPAITARYIRIQPLSWYSWVALRLEIYGCYKEKRSCLDHYKSGTKTDDIYQIYPDGQKNFSVMCDMNGGGWTVFQHRSDGSVDFFRGWTEYKDGFGHLSGEFWLGLEKLHRITTSGKYKLRIDLEDFKGNKRFAEYSSFEVGSETDLFRLSIGAFSGDAGNSMEIHNGKYFTTKDSDHDLTADSNCAKTSKGAWWYEACHKSNLNGLYHCGGNHSSHADGINWFYWKGYNYSMKTVAMKIKEV